MATGIRFRGVSRQAIAALLLCFWAVGQAHAESPSHPLPPAYGGRLHPSADELACARSFAAAERIVGTYYFYWYDDETKLHLLNSDGTDALTTHPPALAGFSQKSVAWHEQQLRDMAAAGIDFLLPVFWGAPSEHEPDAHFNWSYTGLPPLVEAREKLLAEGLIPPAIGLFYDTSTLENNTWRYHADLTTDYGREWFYSTVRDFFSMIPARHWATMEGQPIVFLYSAAFARKHDQSVIDFTKEQFAREFSGRTPYVVPEVSWNVVADNQYAWGGALGLKQPSVSSLGPGYDHSAVLGRTPLVVDRRGGDFYEEQWRQLLQQPSNIVMLETWNEFHEGTDIAESQEYGRQYLELTRKYVDQFKRADRPQSTGTSPARSTSP